MKASTQRALSLAAAGVMLVAAVAIYALLISPEYQQIQALKGELTGKSELYQNQEHAFAQVQDLLAQYHGVSRLEETLSLALPTKEEVADIINQLDAIARANGMFIRSVSLDYLPIKQPKEKGITVIKSLGSLRLSLKLMGSYTAFKNVLGAIETNIRVMDVTLLKAEPTGDEKNKDLFMYTLTVDTYYQPK